MILVFIIFSLLFLAGSMGIVRGAYGIKNRRILGYILVTVGLGTAVYSGLNIYEQIVRIRTDDKIYEVKDMISLLENRVDRLETLKNDFITQRETEFSKLADMGISAEQLQSELTTNTDLREIVERVSLLNRWVDNCITQISSDKTALSNYRSMLFYLENLEKADEVHLDTLPAAAAEVDREIIEKKAKTPQGEKDAMDISHLEVERVIEMYGMQN